MTPEAENYVKELRGLLYGQPVYDPDPGTNYDRVRIGDVGYFSHFGAFLRLFNVFYSESDPINANGVPEGFIPLDRRYRRTTVSQPIPAGVIARNHVQELEGRFSFNSGIIPIGANISLSSSEQNWAVLIIRRPAIREDAECERAFHELIKKNHRAWISFARETRQIEIHLKDIVLVTGHDLTTEWATASVVERSRDLEIEFNVGDPSNAVYTAGTLGSPSTSLAAWGSWTSSVRLPLRFGPIPRSLPSSGVRSPLDSLENPILPDSYITSETLLEDSGHSDTAHSQCVFLRGYRVFLRSLFLRTIKAAAEPKDEDIWDSDEENVEVMAVRLGGIELEDDDEDNTELSPCDPFYAAQNFIFMESDADVAVLHDNEASGFTQFQRTSVNSLCGGLSTSHTLEESEGKLLIPSIHVEIIDGVKVGSLRFDYGPSTVSVANGVNHPLESWTSQIPRLYFDKIFRVPEIFAKRMPAREIEFGDFGEIVNGEFHKRGNILEHELANAYAFDQLSGNGGATDDVQKVLSRRVFNVASDVATDPSEISAASRFTTRYDEVGAVSGLERAVELHVEALAHRPLGRGSSLNNLAGTLKTRYDRKGDLADLECAVELHTEALALHLLSNEDHGSSLNNLANALRIPYDRMGDPADLERAVKLHAEALGSRHPGHEDRNMSLSNLACTLCSRYDRLGEVAELERAIELHKHQERMNSYVLPGSAPERCYIATISDQWDA